MRKIDYFVFQDDKLSGDGNIYTVSQAGVVNIQVINPNNATFKVTILGSLNGMDFAPLGLVVNLSDGNVIKSNGITNTDIYQCDLTAIASVKARIDNSTSNIKVVGLFAD